ncbi:MAG: 50S ribosomal protein L21 [Puniceicoccales bacterium]|jgi:large subunit ribosomal protein L21|nr:50S ribosomal protein L21 [Puniceicoccales bacterium]
MKAIIRIQGKQLTVSEGNIFFVNRYADSQAGDRVEVKEVLLVGEGPEAKLGDPYVAGARVHLNILENKRGKKLIVFKKKRRKGYERKRGHRQELSVVRVESIMA